MYVVGAHIISTYSGKPFTQFVRERIFKPLKMTSTTYSGKEAKLTGNFSHAFTLHESNIRRIPFPFEDENISEFIAGAGGIISNTGDMVSSHDFPARSTHSCTRALPYIVEMGWYAPQRGY